MKSYRLIFLILAIFIGKTVGFCPLLKNTRKELRRQMKPEECLARCDLIMLRPIEKGRCQNCCVKKQWNREMCIKEYPKNQYEISKWHFGIKMKPLKKPWSFPPSNDERKKII